MSETRPAAALDGSASLSDPVMTEPVILITGAPGIGKTTVAQLLARRRPVAAHIEADELHLMIIAGGQWPSARTDRAERQLVLRTRQAAMLARSFYRAGISAIVDEVLGTAAQAVAFEDELGGVPIGTFFLTAPTEVIRARDAARTKHTAVNYIGIEYEISRVVGATARRIDTTGLTPAKTADIIDTALAEGRGRLPIEYRS